MKEVKLPSGALLKITLSPFAVARELYQAILSEVQKVTFNDSTDMTSVLKDFFCYGLTSKNVEKAVWKCLERCTYNDLRVTEDTFEPEEARQDYLSVIREVTEANVSPFVKSLFAEYKSALGIMGTLRSQELQ